MGESDGDCRLGAGVHLENSPTDLIRSNGSCWFSSVKRKLLAGVLSLRPAQNACDGARYRIRRT